MAFENILAGLFGRKSAGIRVSGRVHALIRKGDLARDTEEWVAAAGHYRDALALHPDLFHIQVQHGHALKETGDLAAADAAYRAAARTRPDEFEPVLHRAYLARRTGNEDEAIYGLAAVLHTPAADKAAAALSRLIDAGVPLPAEALRYAVAGTQAATASEPADPLGPDGTGDAGRPLLFDITDLVGHFRYQRLPTGIQRVQVEAVLAALREAADVLICAFVPGRGVCVSIPLPLFRTLAELSGLDGGTAEGEWQAARACLFWHLAVSAEIDLPFDTLIINLGTSLWVADYFRFIRHAKATRRISYVPFVHDLIPAVTPHLCMIGIVEEFTGWLAGVFEHADGFLANSRSTARDLRSVAGRMGRSPDAARVEVVRLDAELGSGATPAPPSSFDRWGLRDVPFVLLVSTIEPRKNHVLAFAAWGDLIRRFGADKVPRLVCAGRDGWMSEDIYHRLSADPDLLGSVVILHHLSDAELSLLYRSSLFTLYPSLYEGWGLPVSESLGHGRLAVVADNSALPEAGSGFALPFTSDDPAALAATVERLLFDGDWRRGKEEALAAGYRPRSWAAIAAQIVSASRRLAEQSAGPPLPEARTGCYYAVNVAPTNTLWPGLVQGEVFRSGAGWAWPEPDGCRVRAEGGELRMALAPIPRPEPRSSPVQAWRLHFRVRGLATERSTVTLLSGDLATEAVLEPGETAWIGLDVPDGAPGAALTVTLRGDTTETVRMYIGGAERTHHLSVKLLGFLVWQADDGRGAAAVMNNIDHWRVKG